MFVVGQCTGKNHGTVYFIFWHSLILDINYCTFLTISSKSSSHTKFLMRYTKD